MKQYITYDGELRFGEHKYKRLGDIPTGYLRWMLSGMDNLDNHERDQVRSELRTRDYAEQHARERARYSSSGYSSSSGGSGGNNGGTGNNYNTAPRLPANITPDDLLKVISAGRRGLALIHHPDRGGSPDAMLKANVAADWLEQVIRALPGGAA
jgi:hypothetical protein